MLPALIKTLRRIITDISAGRQIEAYALTIIALGVTVATMLDNALPLDVQMAVLLAGVGLLVFKTTVPLEKQYWFEYWAKQFEIMWEKARDH